MTKTPLDILAQTIRKTREARGLSQMDLAHKLNMNPHTIMDFEVGRSNPKAETVFLIADELDISLDAILFASTETCCTLSLNSAETGHSAVARFPL